MPRIWISLILTAGTLYPYLGSTGVYRCPSDQTKVPIGQGKQASVIRSYATLYALNSTGGYYDTTVIRAPWFKCEKLAAILIPGPSAVWAFAEPTGGTHDVAGWDFIIGEAPHITDWAAMPTDRHSAGCNLTFLDGHVLFHKWKAPKEKHAIGGRLNGTQIAEGGDRDDFTWLFEGHPRKY